MSGLSITDLLSTTLLGTSPTLWRALSVVIGGSTALRTALPRTPG